jgi:hypothetical protein
VPLIGTGTDDELIDRFGLQQSRYEGPTGITGVLHDACQRRSLPSLSLWAAVPAYAPGTASPKAALALVRRVAGIVGSPVDTGSLERASIAYVAEVSEQVSEDEDLVGYVHTLEQNADDEASEDDTGESGGMTGHEEGSVDRLVEELERYLRDQGSEG